MKMTLRWFGSKYDTVTLEQIRQIPGCVGVITTLYDTKPGEVWSVEAIKAMKAEVEAAGLEVSGIESVNIHDDIKIGLETRDAYIANYIETLEHLGKEGIDLVCYNFMPIFDWTRSDLSKVRADGSTVLSYDQDIIDKIDPSKMFDEMEHSSGGFILPGWEPERLTRVKELFEMYSEVDEEKLFQNLVYFLKAIMPTCEQYDIKMAIHMDDPAWKVFGLPRIINNKENIQRLLDAVPIKNNGLTLCTGSLGSNPLNDIPDMIRSFKGRIHFGHMRNLIHLGPRKFDEAAHLSSDGSLDMFEIMKAFYEIAMTGPIRPDHGRMIWGEKSMPGYGLYDRALGATYLNGLWEAIEKSSKSIL
ncbi:mannonate dehydratase [Fusibacter sp. 3D3]|uniref:mannonate dehydratase n=1 Tax=Fusibacter sp. 3D3 TaxID=1048380 RepID=UPI000852906C|nr:mannonate dehydratase [Fusibacter sp. 3D3]GAU75586.1 mannonate dehydratase [Fusibacter sp. 3D3]